MRVLQVMVVSTVFGALSLMGCLDSAEGTWSGTTSDCSNADLDDEAVTILVVQDRATLNTLLAMPTETAEAFSTTGGTLETVGTLAFSETRTSESTAIAYTVDLTPNDDGSAQEGTIDVSVNGAGSSRCALRVTR